MDVGTLVSKPCICGGGTCGPTPIRTDLAWASSSWPPVLCKGRKQQFFLKGVKAQDDSVDENTLFTYLRKRNQPECAVELGFVD